MNALFAWNLGYHIMGVYCSTSVFDHWNRTNRERPEGYQFLMQNCTFPSNIFVWRSYGLYLDSSGDKICIFGLSKHSFMDYSLADWDPSELR